MKASNNDGIWNEKGKSIKIVIVPPFWRTWWFRVTITMVVLGSTFAWYQIRLNAIKKQKEELEVQVKERTIEVSQQKQELQAQAENLLVVNTELLSQKVR